MDKKEIITCKRYPLKFYVRPGTSDEKAIREVIEKNSYQKPKLGFTINPGEKWVDLGANIGAFSVLAACLGASVRAFEPDPDSFLLLKENLELNGLSDKVELFNVAVAGDLQKKAWFSVSEKNKNYWRNSIVKQWQGSRMIQVPCINFREAFSGSDCVKMDIEGAEMQILEKLDFSPKKLVFEWSFDIDASCDRFRLMIERIRPLFSELFFKPPPADAPLWKWFPAALMVHCKN